MRAEERHRLHCVPAHPWTAAFGETRIVGCPQPMIQLDWCLYSVPHRLAGETVWVRQRGEEVIVTHVGPDGPVEVARHIRTTPGNPRVEASHFPPVPEGPLNRTPVPANAAEAEFLAIGDGAVLWLKEAGAVGYVKVRRRSTAFVIKRFAANEREIAERPGNSVDVRHARFAGAEHGSSGVELLNQIGASGPRVVPLQALAAWLVGTGDALGSKAVDMYSTQRRSPIRTTRL